MLPPRRSNETSPTGVQRDGHGASTTYETRCLRAAAHDAAVVRIDGMPSGRWHESAARRRPRGRRRRRGDARWRPSRHGRTRRIAMQLGMIGLGRMGANMVRRLQQRGHDCVAFDMNPAAVAAAAKDGAAGAASLEELVAKTERAARDLDDGAGRGRRPGARQPASAARARRRRHRRRQLVLPRRHPPRQRSSRRRTSITSMWAPAAAWPARSAAIA